MNIKRTFSAIITAVVITGNMNGCSEKDSKEIKNIIPELKCGMQSSEVFEILGSEYDYNEEAYPINDEHTKEMYCYNLESVANFDVDMKAYIFVEIADDDKLVNYGYHIGAYLNEENQFIYPYTESELISGYDKIYSKLSEWYGEGKDCTSADYADFLKGYEWNTEQGDIWFVTGTDLWGIQGQNEIVLSCYDFSAYQK